MRSQPAAENVHNTVFPKKAADRTTVYCLFAFIMMCCFFVFKPTETHALTVGNSSGGIFGQTVIQNGVIYTPFTVRTVRYVRHTQFLTAEQDKPHAYKQASAGNGGPFTGFSYKCPGWYVTRAYSDNAGTNLLGYIRIYVSESDGQGSGCAAIAKPPEKPPAIENKTVNVTHPNPNKVENKNMSSKTPTVGSNAPKNNGYPEDEPAPKPKPANPKPVEPVEPENPDDDGIGNGGNVKPPIEPKPEPPVIEKPDPRTGPIPEEWQQSYINQEKMCAANDGGRYFIMDAFSNNPDYKMGCVDKAAWEQCNEQWPCGNIIRPFKPYGEDPEPPSTENPGTEPEPEEVCEGPNDRCEYYEFICEDGTDCEEMDFIPFSVDDPGGEGGCGICEFFKCPGFDKFVGHLYDIADYTVGDVNPPPVPNLPRPEIPNIFDILNKVDERNPAKPTGQEDPGLGTNTFNADDIKNGAGDIEFREDPTGGFNIVNPLDTLPDDGSTAPRPKEKLETLPYPGGGGNLTESGNTPSPSNSSNYDGKVEMPTNPGGTAKPPTDTGGTVQQPTTDGTAKYPTIE